jgi:hypothetical protein
LSVVGEEGRSEFVIDLDELVCEGATLAGQVGCPVQPIRFSHALWRVAE